MQQVSLADTLLFEPLPTGRWRFFCTDPALAGKDNLVYRAAAILEERAGKPLPGVRLTLYKNIPVEAGLAGGSSDAAAALVGLDRFWQLGLGNSELISIATRLGSDVPYCLQGGTVLARGRGERLERLPALPFFWVVLVLPQEAKISTAAAYAAFDRGLLGKPELQPLIDAIRLKRKDDIIEWLDRGFTNTLETANLQGTFRAGKLKRRLQALGLQPVFSGSGPAMFILIDNYSLAGSIARAVEEEGGRAYLCWTLTGGRE